MPRLVKQSQSPYLGVSPSGKAWDFDSHIHWFESSHPCQKEIAMNSKGHLIISAIKSSVRIISCVFSLVKRSLIILAGGFLLAELLGIVEELVDNR